ncbi:MAG TPA: 3' terminal RNA ribose 2'-O-methyltransferase Hen1 [Trebonia sp.]|nr:3' terminal RNA ribose 2'-O-methyltransferase Hen1 [Trebonia sp.]
MLLTVTTTRAPAADLGFLLHKHPGRAQSFGVASGTAHVFYPEASDERCTAALLLEVDPVALARGTAGSVTHYVNDRPYAASSLLAVALKSVFGTALAGRCPARPELAASAIPLEIRVPALRCVGGPELAQRFFRPLGWDVRAQPVPLVPASWGDSPYVDLRLTGTVRLADALNHVYVALPVLDDSKHYWVSTDEVDKLVRAGAGWLAAHPEKELIARRYLAHRRMLTDAALARLAEADDLDPADLDNAVPELAPEPEPGTGPEPEPQPEAAAEPLTVLRRRAVLGVLREAGARTVADLGCGEGALAGDLLRDGAFTRVIAADVSARALTQAARRLRLDRMPEARRARLEMFQSSLTYRDARLAGLDAAVLMEVIEHVDPDRLHALERSVFGFAAPATVVVTTPNREYNPEYGMPAGALRHRDHRFEWDRAEFAAWADRVAAAYGYAVRLAGAGPESPTAGPPTQLAVFSRPVPGNTVLPGNTVPPGSTVRLGGAA